VAGGSARGVMVGHWEGRSCRTGAGENAEPLLADWRADGKAVDDWLSSQARRRLILSS
jgi:hypothetical protein